MFEIAGKHNTAKVFADHVDNETISQLTALLNQEYVAGSRIRIMADTHAGRRNPGEYQRYRRCSFCN